MRAAAVSVLLLAALCVASAGRVGPDDLFSSVKDAWNNVGTMQRWFSSHHHGHEDKPAYVAFKYLVDPEDKEEFLDAWEKLEDATKQEKGVRIFDLKKPATNNYMFIGYGEWECGRDAMEHFESDYVKDFLDTLSENDIQWTAIPLLRPDVGELHFEGDEEANRGKTSKQQAHVIIRYHVPPSKEETFLDAWNEAEKGTEDEEGAHIYSLRKVLADNTHFIAYGTWETRKDFYEHFESDHVRELRETLDEHGITWDLAPVIKMGDQPE